MMRFILFLLLFGAVLSAHTQSPARNGKDYGVFFYVTTFQPGWAALPETAREAADLKKELEDNYGFVCELVANPTRQQMRTKIREYNARLTANDQVLYFFSMHGYYSEVGDRGYLVPKDGVLDDPYGDTWLSYDDLRTDLAPCKARHILLALDACHSGAFGIRNKSAPETPVYEQAEDCATQFGKTMRYGARQYCTSGNKNAKTPARSLFAARFLEALRKGGDGKMVRFDDLEYWIGKVESPQPESGSYYGHEPGGNFVFVRKDACTATGTPVVDSNNAPSLADTDNDGIPDNRDGCPNEYGLAQTNGCPDRDNDGVSDKSDKCRDKAGELRWQGCPDSDGDGVPDHEDQCPDQAGKMALEGCPDITETMLDNSLVFVTGGTFMMGSPESETDHNYNEYQHEVTLSDFYIGKYEVTQKQWVRVMGSNPSRFSDCETCPVEMVSWNDVQEFLKKLNAMVPASQKPYRLPTEAEWEYAARGGGQPAMFGTGRNLLDPKEVNFDATDASVKQHPYHAIVGEYRGKTIPVGSLNSPNALGLHDMSGNVYEWCSDWVADYYYRQSPTENPQGPDSSTIRAYRGGCWRCFPLNCRVAARNGNVPGYRHDFVGFRIARSK